MGHTHMLENFIDVPKVFGWCTVGAAWCVSGMTSTFAETFPNHQFAPKNRSAPRYNVGHLICPITGVESGR